MNFLVPRLPLRGDETNDQAFVSRVSVFFVRGVHFLLIFKQL